MSNEKPKSLGIHVEEDVNVNESIGTDRPDKVEFNAVALLKVMPDGKEEVVRRQFVNPAEPFKMRVVSRGKAVEVKYLLRVV